MTFTGLSWALPHPPSHPHGSWSVVRARGSSLARLRGLGIARRWWGSQGAGRISFSSPLLNNKIARPGSVPPSVAVSPRICYLPCLPCLYTPCTKDLLRATVGLLCLRQGLWIRTRKVLCCPRAGTRWRTFCTQRYSKVEPSASASRDGGGRICLRGAGFQPTWFHGV